MTKVLRSWVGRLKRQKIFFVEYRSFKKSSVSVHRDLKLEWRDRYPCLIESLKETEFDRHYLYHTAWAARCLAADKPKEHIDISSDLRFVTLVSAFIPVKFYDYRPATISLSNFLSEQADLLGLPFKSGSIHSLSCMHVVEHIGLGRYGDVLDPMADIKAIKELKRVVAPGGRLMLVVPVGRPCVMFNAHRVYSYEMIMEEFDDWKLEKLALIRDDVSEEGIIENPDSDLINSQKYGCGCFLFVRPK